jgi:hypothetical protein
MKIRFKHARIARKSVFICAPYASDVKVNVFRAKQIARMLWEAGYTPIVPHISADFFSELTERDKALDYCLNLLDGCDYIYIDLENGISAGMQGEIAYARAKGLKNLEVGK